jgi:Uma2 family endonuclease
MAMQIREDQDQVVYPETDGKPMAENTLQYEWITTIKGNLDIVFRGDPNVFVAGDLFWYPVKGRPDIRAAPDVLVACGRPAGHRRSYLQWREEVAPHVVFEILSPGNRPEEMDQKFEFYDHYGVEEYYIYDPEIA